jgi:coenzyme F420-0:L-glutamate ligase / coenzyme F420-1:gamma-L-glutamate ligase
MTLEIYPLEGIGAVVEGDDVATLLEPALRSLAARDGDVLVVTHKIVSKAEGAVREIIGDEEAFKKTLVSEIARSIVRRRGDLIIAETKHGFVCANAGVDRSNAAPGTMILLPEDPDRSAHRIRTRLQRSPGCGPAGDRVRHVRPSVATGSHRRGDRCLGSPPTHGSQGNRRLDRP